MQADRDFLSRGCDQTCARGNSPFEKVAAQFHTLRSSAFGGNGRLQRVGTYFDRDFIRVQQWIPNRPRYTIPFLNSSNG